jgi:transposase
MDHAGKVLLNTTYKNTREDAEKFVTMGLSKYKDCIAVCESTARMWIKTYETFEQYSIPIKLANTLRMRLSQSGPKTDKIDAKKLANRLRMKDIPECYVHTPESRRTLDILYQRVSLVQERTRILNRQHSILDKYDYNVMARNGDTSSEKRGCCVIPSDLVFACAPLWFYRRSIRTWTVTRTIPCHRMVSLSHVSGRT